MEQISVDEIDEKLIAELAVEVYHIPFIHLRRGRLSEGDRMAIRAWLKREHPELKPLFSDEIFSQIFLIIYGLIIERGYERSCNA